MTAYQLAKSLGMSYRQLDTWTTKGHLSCTWSAAPGTDERRYRIWSEQEVAVAGWMRRLVDIGLRLPAAERIARELVCFPTLPVYLGPGLQIRATDWEAGDDYHPFAREYATAFVDAHGNEVENPDHSGPKNSNASGPDAQASQVRSVGA